MAKFDIELKFVIVSYRESPDTKSQSIKTTTSDLVVFTNSSYSPQVQVCYSLYNPLFLLNEVVCEENVCFILVKGNHTPSHLPLLM